MNLEIIDLKRPELKARNPKQTWAKINSKSENPKQQIRSLPFGALSLFCFSSF
jgi:hypothetical protein